MGQLIIPPSVRSGGAGTITLPNPKSSAGNAGKVLTVNPAGDGYLLAAAAGGGGNAVQGFNRAQPGTVTQNAGYYSFSNWSWDPTWSNFGWVDSTVPPQLIAAPGGVPTDQGFSNRDAGWFFERIRIQTNSNAAKLDLKYNRGSNSGGIDTTSYYHAETIFPSTDGTYDHTAWVGPFYLPAGNVNYSPFLFNVYFTGTPTHSSFTFRVDVISGAR